MKTNALPVEKERTLLRLYKLSLEHFKSYEGIGLCSFVIGLNIEEFITDEEYLSLSIDLNYRKPKEVTGCYWFKNKYERIEFLENIIKELSCKK